MYEHLSLEEKHQLLEETTAQHLAALEEAHRIGMARMAISAAIYADQPVNDRPEAFGPI